MVDDDSVHLYTNLQRKNLSLRGDLFFTLSGREFKDLATDTPRPAAFLKHSASIQSKISQAWHQSCSDHTTKKKMTE